MLIFATVGLAITSSTLTTHRTNRANQRKGVAVNLAHQVLECVKSQLQAGRPINATNAGTDCNSGMSTAGFTVGTPAITPNPTGFSGLTRIQVTISWNSPLPDSIAFDWLVDT